MVEVHRPVEINDLSRANFWSAKVPKVRAQLGSIRTSALQQRAPILVDPRHTGDWGKRGPRTLSSNEWSQGFLRWAKKGGVPRIRFKSLGGASEGRASSSRSRAGLDCGKLAQQMLRATEEESRRQTTSGRNLGNNLLLISELRWRDRRGGGKGNQCQPVSLCYHLVCYRHQCCEWTRSNEPICDCWQFPSYCSIQSAPRLPQNECRAGE